MKKHIILMGDIINSSKFPPEKLSKDFQKVIGLANNKFSKKILTGELTITLGDEFQGLVSNFKSAIEMMTFVDEQIIKANLPFRLRYSLYWGEVQNKINKQKAWGMLGPGFTECRQILNKMKKHSQFEINGFEQHSQETKLIAKLLESKRMVQEKWNEKDLTIVIPYLNQKSVSDISKMEKKAKQQIQKRIKTLNLELYDNLAATIAYLSEQF